MWKRPSIARVGPGASLARILGHTLQPPVPSLFTFNILLRRRLLNIDGVTGGFNFQSAWTTGYLAGLAMAAAMRD